MSEITLPLPNDTFDGRTVVASGYLNDDAFLLVLLNAEAPYFSVVETNVGGGIVSEVRYRNIVPAVVAYEASGGFFGWMSELAHDAEFGKGLLLVEEAA